MKKRILYVSCHKYLQEDETKLFIELGYDVVVKGFNEPFEKEFIKVFDIIIVMWMPKWVEENWESIKDKVVIMRTIGQSTEQNELEMKPLKEKGMKIVRYSPMERNIPSYCGENAIIRFYKDPKEWRDWNGRNDKVINVTQSMFQRKDYCGYQPFMDATEGMPRKIYGHNNSPMGELWGGELSRKNLKKVYRDNRVYFYTGTQPASYTLNFMEALMTGIPIVAIGSKLGNPHFSDQNVYEIPNIIQQGVNGFFSDDIGELRYMIIKYLKDYDQAKRIGEAGRKTAIELFGKENIKKEWEKFLNECN